jgi:hypothetical protein
MSAFGPEFFGPEQAQKMIEKKLTVLLRQVLVGGVTKEYSFKSLYLSPQKIFVLSEDLTFFKKGEELRIEVAYKNKQYDLGKGIVKQIQAVSTASLRGFEIMFKHQTPARVKQLKEILFY